MRIWWSFARGKRFALGAALATTAVICAPLIVNIRFPIPLNEVGAQGTLLTIAGLLAILPWGEALDASVPSVEQGRPGRLVRLRCATYALQLGVVVAVAAIIAVWFPVTAVRLGSAMVFFLGLYGATTWLPTAVPRWAPGVTLLLTMIVFGVDRTASEPHAWAFLLHDSPTILVSELVPAGLSMIIGGALLAAHGPPGD